jgi:3-isopropylmalate/(R)-2-methylmalate dehydratase small subunit
MEKFIKHVGSGVPLRRSNVDTDQIIPAVYLKRVTRSGFEDGLFSAWRNDPDFVLNQEAFKKGTILVAGPEFLHRLKLHPTGFNESGDFSAW